MCHTHGVCFFVTWSTEGTLYSMFWCSGNQWTQQYVSSTHLFCCVSNFLLLGTLTSLSVNPMSVRHNDLNWHAWMDMGWSCKSQKLIPLLSFQLVGRIEVMMLLLLDQVVLSRRLKLDQSFAIPTNWKLFPLKFIYNVDHFSRKKKSCIESRM